MKPCMNTGSITPPILYLITRLKWSGLFNAGGRTRVPEGVGCTVQLKCDGTRWRREGKWRGNWRIEWVDSTLHTTSEHGVSSITTTDGHTSAASSWLNWRPADLNGLVRFAGRRNLVSARVPSHFKRSLQLVWEEQLVYVNSNGPL
jgi:hypothetical protein